MEPTRDDDAIVDVLDVLLRDGAMIQADVIVTVADVPLIGINLRAAVAGMATMREYGFFEDWDAATRAQATGEQRAATRRGRFVPREESGTHGEADSTLPSMRPKPPKQSERRRSPPSERPDRSQRPRESDSWSDEETSPSGRPHDSERPGDPDRSSLRERPGGTDQRSLSDRPRGPEEPREFDVSAGDLGTGDSETMASGPTDDGVSGVPESPDADADADEVTGRSADAAEGLDQAVDEDDADADAEVTDRSDVDDDARPDDAEENGRTDDEDEGSAPSDR